MQEKHSNHNPSQNVTVTSTTGHSHSLAAKAQSSGASSSSCCSVHHNVSPNEPVLDTKTGSLPTSRSFATEKTNSQILDICSGHKHFREVQFPLQEKKYSDLVKNGQKPKALFISCSDSRIIPDDLLNVGPGDLFITRNIGAFVPPYNLLLDGFHSVGAVIEFAVNFLKVTDVIVCGHSDCGACAALFSPEFDKPREEVDEVEWRNTTHLRNWLKLGAETKEIVKQHNIENPKERQELTARVSVVMQISNLLTYPYIKEKIDNNELAIHGWFYDIQKGVVEYYDPEKKRYYDSLDLEKRGVPRSSDIDTENPLKM
eukprot:CAMPEP_0117451166 /NCGR_PEP_ID=MMETSP0759-20121206/8863_1 /TAXON_ID=63605 /ORGANISM="Percolomonas cosmopolitus, Strain WS" /LENGTH=314 /DNA_ID=CAMNT_0005243749 /DNA_START=374 /DNA_END=1318 /DNA_ORIENTATION=+